MPRILPAQLTTAMDSGNFQPYFLITAREGFTAHIITTATPVKFSLRGIDMTAKWLSLSGNTFSGTNRASDVQFKITRGVTILGVNYTIDSSWYFGISQTWDGIYQSITACMLPNLAYSPLADVSYQSLIYDVFASYGCTPVYYDPAAAWKSYKFLKTGSVLTLGRVNNIITILRQKYLIECCDNGNNEILLQSVANDVQTGLYYDYSMQAGLIKQIGTDANPRRRFMSKDEIGNVTYSGTTDDPIWNLGYLESTDAKPILYASSPFEIEPIAPNLKYLSFDRIKFTMVRYPTSYINELYINADIEESFDIKRDSVAWQNIIHSYNWASGPEGGSLPNTVEKAGQYTPLNTTYFSNNLNATINNVQALAEAVDDLVLGSGDMLKATYDTDNDGTVDNAELLQGNAASAFAIAAKGVTNGDSHDHNGGDGAAITDANLSTSDITTNDASTSKHGFLKKLSNVATQYMDGTGSYSVPAGTGTPTDGWISISATGTSGTLDTPSFEISFNADMTAIIGLGDRIKITQSTTKYFIVTKVGAFSAGATIITCYGGTDYTLVASGTTAITTPYVSHVKIPFGFPMSPSKWTVEVSNSNDCTKTTPTVSTWYGGSGLTSTGPSIDIPIGVWRVRYKTVASDVFTTAALTALGIRATLSTANNTQSDTDFTTTQALETPIVAVSGVARFSAQTEKYLTLTTKTTYYLNIFVGSVTAGDVIGFLGTVVPTILQASCVYL
jgi:hypothetical protein